LAGRGSQIQIAPLPLDGQGADLFPEDAAALHGNFAAGNGADAFRVKFVFGGVDALMQARGGVMVENGYGLLADDGAGIHAGVHKMHGAAGDFHAVVERLFPGFESGKGGQQRGVDVHDAAFKRTQKITLQDAHEPGEDDQIHLGRLQLVHEGALGVLVQLGAEFSRGDEAGGKIAFAGVDQNPRGFDIAQDDGGGRRDFPRGDGIGDGDKVGTFAGTENADAKWIAHGDLNSRATG